MISYLKGKILENKEKYIVLDVNGVGYKIHIHPDFSAEISIKEQSINKNLNQKKDEYVEFWTYLAVKEDSLNLYGLSSPEELYMFELLLSVSGIGPKTALGIVGATGTNKLKEAIRTGKTEYLVKVCGVSKKNADKIALELKGKIKEDPNDEKLENTESEKDDADVLDALETFGYSQSEGRKALKSIRNEITGTKSKLREALKILSK